MESSIRLVKEDELELLRDICLETFQRSFGKDNTPEDMEIYLEKTFNREKLQNDMSNPLVSFYFLIHNSEIAGYLRLNEGSAQTDDVLEGALEIERIYVLPEKQNKNLGAALIEKSVEIARERDINTLWLGVWNKNSNAIRFYERHGFRPFGIHEFLLGNDLQTDLLMMRMV